MGGAMRLALAVLIAAGLLAGCGSALPGASSLVVTPGPASPDPADTAGPRLRYVALGDSYTIGTSVREAERWPNQLTTRLPALELVANLGVNGFTSRDLIEIELPKLAALRPEVVTVLIGVNDVVQGVPSSTYDENVRRILRELERQVGATRILVVTIPDYTVTPSGGEFGDPAQQAAGIRESNRVMTRLALAAGITVVDIHDISLDAATDRTLVATDGLHPSGAQYARWVDRILPAMEAMLAR